MRRFSKFSLATLILLGLAAGIASAAKPPKNTPPPTAPPVRYELKTFRMPDLDVGNIDVHQMTSTGIVVGTCRMNGGARYAYIYDPSLDPDVAINLNDLPIDGLDADWTLVGALDVNEHGFVVGAMENSNNPGVWRGYLLDLAVDPPVLTTLPDGPAHSYARRINDNMDILGITAVADGAFRVYLHNPLDEHFEDLGVVATNALELSNPPLGQPAQVVGQFHSTWKAFRYTSGVGMDPTLSSFQAIPHGINSTGGFCGRYDQPNKGGKNYSYYAFRYGNTLETFPNWSPAAGAINTAGDLAAHSNRQLYHQGTGMIDLNTVVTGSAADIAIWSGSWSTILSDMTERGALNPDVPNFPGMCGDLYGSQTGPRGMLLVPIAP